MNKKIISMLLMLIFTTGCSLYKDNRSPIYNSLADKKANRASASFANNVGGRIPLVINGNSKKLSIEKPGRKTIEVKSSNNNPYVDVVANKKRQTKVVRPDRVRIKKSKNLEKPNDLTKGYPLAEKKVSKKSDELKQSSKKRVKEKSEQVRSNVSNNVDEKKSEAKQAIKNSEDKVAKQSVDSQKTEQTKTATENKKSKTASRPKAKKKTAVQSLLKEAHNAVKQGNLDSASAALERAHRIEPSNAKILYDIAQIKYALGKYREADSFASRATNFSKSRSLSKKIWQLLYNARKSQGNKSGAALAKQKVDSF